MKVLSLSDKVLDFIYSPEAGPRFSDVDLVIGCGDLPYYYLEFVLDTLEVPVFFVRGNHANVIEYGDRYERKAPWGAIDLHDRAVNHQGLLLAGFEGSVRYKKGPYMYTQGEMWWHVLKLVPSLLLNRLQYGRSLDVLVTHAPPWGVHDQEDIAHHGFRAFRWLLRVFRPAYHFHGHIHVYTPDTLTETQFFDTCVINSYGYRETEIETPKARYTAGWKTNR